MKIELIQPHEHQREKHLPGATIEVSEEQGKWLIEIGTARTPTPALPRKSPPAKAPEDKGEGARKNRNQPKEQENADH